MLRPLHGGGSSHLPCKAPVQCHRLSLQRRRSCPAASPALGPCHEHGTRPCQTSISPADDASMQHSENLLEHKETARTWYSTTCTKLRFKTNHGPPSAQLLPWTWARLTQDTKVCGAVAFSLLSGFCFVVYMIIFSLIFKCPLLLVKHLIHFFHVLD